MNIKKIYYIDTFGLIEGVDMRVITIQREQYGGTVHLFIGTGHSPGENTFMTLICILNRNINHQGLTSLFLFGSMSYLTFVAILSRSCYLLAIASAFVVIVFRQCLHLNDLRRGKRYSS
jgi:molybdopterin biosynthesis enzyme MoaB